MTSTLNNFLLICEKQVEMAALDEFLRSPASDVLDIVSSYFESLLKHMESWYPQISEYRSQN